MLSNNIIAVKFFKIKFFKSIFVFKFLKSRLNKNKLSFIYILRNAVIIVLRYASTKQLPRVQSKRQFLEDVTSY